MINMANSNQVVELKTVCVRPACHFVEINEMY